MATHHEERFPWMHVIGFVLSVLLTIVALWAVESHALHQGPLLFIIMALAVVQIFVQLFFFMHITENYGPAYHSVMLIIAVINVIAIVGGSMWIMSFNAQVS